MVIEFGVSVEKPWNNLRARDWLPWQVLQCCGHGARLRSGLNVNHRNESKLMSTLSSNELFSAWRGARQNQGRFVKGENFAESIVTTHCHDSHGFVHNVFHPFIEG